MKINVGSKNDVKISAVREAILNYKFLSKAEVSGIDVSSGFSGQPKSLGDTISGAMDRAKNAFRNCDYSFGIEDGLMQVPHAKSGYMNVCACAICDGKEYYLGLSSAFEYPVKVMRIILEDGLEASEAFYKAGLTENPKIGSSEGIIGILTRGKLIRKEYTKQAITTALIHLQNE